MFFIWKSPNGQHSLSIPTAFSSLLSALGSMASYWREGGQGHGMACSRPANVQANGRIWRIVRDSFLSFSPHCCRFRWLKHDPISTLFVRQACNCTIFKKPNDPSDLKTESTDLVVTQRIRGDFPVEFYQCEILPFFYAVFKNGVFFVTFWTGNRHPFGVVLNGCSEIQCFTSSGSKIWSL